VRDQSGLDHESAVSFGDWCLIVVAILVSATVAFKIAWTLLDYLYDFAYALSRIA
jgi:hypothetical protein